MAENKETLMLTLVTSDKQEFLVSKQAAMLSLTIKHMLEDDCESGVTPLPNVDSKVLSKIIVYLNKHADHKSLSNEEKKDLKEKGLEEELKKNEVEKEELKKFDDEFVSDKPIEVLFHWVMAANYLNIEGLLDLICRKIADLIKDKSSEEVRALFNIKNDFEPGEEEEAKMENQWAHE